MSCVEIFLCLRAGGIKDLGTVVNEITLYSLQELSEHEIE